MLSPSYVLRTYAVASSYVWNAGSEPGEVSLTCSEASGGDLSSTRSERRAWLLVSWEGGVLQEITTARARIDRSRSIVRSIHHARVRASSGPGRIGRRDLLGVV